MATRRRLTPFFATEARRADAGRRDAAFTRRTVRLREGAARPARVALRRPRVVAALRVPRRVVVRRVTRVVVFLLLLAGIALPS
ncbi:hypothetical protein P2318_30835 [Myxococcaceae bacterium GXIMD 01537]